ncbi:hypothetical protein [Pseudomonas sichuanensis]|uniref:hypothetical protein n=1 Tax=Pseudomonas sichuanensis TaxID=2213015 RepID=UPI00215EB647|nr:hypothetical protein [Pseudomonas sichuanensis]UVL88911.1 hypothetical protein LOY51_24685 [Pseudomonas sichuanensis]
MADLAWASFKIFDAKAASGNGTLCLCLSLAASSLPLAASFKWQAASKSQTGDGRSGLGVVQDL